MNILANSPFLDVILFIIVLIVVLVASYFLYKGIKKDLTKSKNEKLLTIEGVITKNEIKSLVSTYMNNTNLKSMFSLIYIDLDKFEDFNSAFGDKETKNILKTISVKIRDLLPAHTYISRYTRDDFLIFIPERYSYNEVLIIADGILKSFRQKIKVFGDEEIDLTASIAVAQYPNNGSNLNTLLESLNLSISKIKKEGGNALKVFTNTMEQESEQVNYYYQIKNAMAQNEFKLYYQPIVSIKDKKVYALEALLRWEHSELGVLSPHKFISIMEQSGDIHWVGQWGFEKLVKLYLSLREELGNDVPLLTINLSPKQLIGQDLVDGFAKILKKHKVDAKNFVLEVGEFDLVEKQQIIYDNLQRLKKMNFRTSIDGFGIDIMTLDKLEEFAFDEVKMSYKVLVEDGFAISKYIEVLMEYINIKNKVVICQGIEDSNNEIKAAGFGINLMQGYKYSKPMDQSDILDFINNYINNNEELIELDSSEIVEEAI